MALKAMLPALAASPSAKQRFLREARAAAAIKHDHIVTIYQVGEDRGVPFLAMEFLKANRWTTGSSAKSRLPPGRGRCASAGRSPRAGGRPRARPDPSRHQAGQHLAGRGDAAGSRSSTSAWPGRPTDDAHLTQSGAIVGTPAYMAPEQAAARHVDARCDLFSLGCVLYRMATGELPFKGTDTSPR